MIKKWIFYALLLSIVAFLFYSFKSLNNNNNDWYKISDEDDLHFLFPSEIPDTYTSLKIPFTGKFFIGYKEAIGFKESQGKYHKINSLGYMGKYQFGKSTLKSIGITDSLRFLNNPKLQEKAFVALLSKNKWILRDEIKKYSGKTISGIKITESGILAAAHLGGAGSVKRFLKSNGTKYRADKYGSTIRSYMKKFGGYETVGIVASKNASVK